MNARNHLLAARTKLIAQYLSFSVPCNLVLECISDVYLLTNGRNQNGFGLSLQNVLKSFLAGLKAKNSYFSPKLIFTDKYKGQMCTIFTVFGMDIFLCLWTAYI